MSALIGVSGAARNACAAIVVDGGVRAVCEQERLTRVRGVGLVPGALPADAVDEVLALSRRRPADVSAYVTAEPEVRLPERLRRVDVDHHHAHAAAAFLTAPFQRAAILVCDRHAGRELSVWTGEGTTVRDLAWPWTGPAFAALYSECAEIFAGGRPAPAHRLEALAHLGRGQASDRLRTLFRREGDRLVLEPGWQAQLHELVERERLTTRTYAVETASAVQHRIGELLLQVVADVRAAVDADALCLGGGLFYNTWFTTLISRSGLFRDVFVPISPGNAGLAVGASLACAHHDGNGPAPHAVSPFLGPEYDSEAIKAVLDGCKLSYAYVSEPAAIDAAVDALTRGQLVGWFQERMEWGHRALGHRSILANPQSPYVLDNLNSFLRKRERWRAFGVSVCGDAAPNLFCGPPASPFMEFEYGLKDRERLQHVLPAGASSIRVQTVARDAGAFWTLHKRMEQATGTGVLVNTSFNGFHEPIVCSPRDAIRVFYGTGLDLLVLGRFVLRK